MSEPDPARRHGLRRKPSHPCNAFTPIDANDALRSLALDLATDSFRLSDLSYEREKPAPR